MIHHGVDGVLELENFAAYVHGDLFGQITLGHSGSDVGNVANLAREIGGHRVHGISKVLPCAGHAPHIRLAAQPAFRADFTSHACYLRRKRTELVDDRVDGVFQL